MSVRLHMVVAVGGVATLAAVLAVILIVSARARRAADAAARGDELAQQAQARARNEQQEHEEAQAKLDEQEAIAAKKAKDEAAMAKAVAQIRAMTIPQRVAMLDLLCEPAGDKCSDEQMQVVVDTAATPAEHKSLQSAVEKASAVHYSNVRVRYAAAFDTDLLDQHLSPESVEATGAGRTTLSIRGYFCSRQWAYDYAKGPNWTTARQVGFVRMECTDLLGRTYADWITPQP